MSRAMAVRDSLGKVTVSFLLLGVVNAVFMSRMTTRTLCINSVLPNVQSMCVKCDAAQFQSTSMMCTGQPTVPAMTNETQAFCLISKCLQQTGQQGQAIGRKRRTPAEMLQLEKVSTSLDYDPDDL